MFIFQQEKLMVYIWGRQGNYQKLETRKKLFRMVQEISREDTYRYYKNMILTNNEDLLISGSNDKTIIVWSVNYQTNQIEYQYQLENKHYIPVFGLSLNDSETLLVSCGGEKQIIQWAKEQNNQYIHKNSVKLPNYLSRVCIVDGDQLLVQQDRSGFTKVFLVVNQQLLEQEDLQITLNDQQENSDYSLFPTIYNKSKEIIIQKSHEYVYIIRKQSNGTFKLEGQPIYCETDKIFGNLTQDGEYIVIWNSETKEFGIYKISYGEQIKQNQQIPFWKGHQSFTSFFIDNRSDIFNQIKQAINRQIWLKVNKNTLSTQILNSIQIEFNNLMN